MAEWVTRYSTEISTGGTVVFAIVGAWAMLMQGRKIWDNRSTRSISSSLNWFSFCYFFSGFIYGLEYGKWALIIHGTLRWLTLLPVALGMLKFHTHTRLEKFMAIGCVCLIPTMALIPEKDVLFAALSVLGVCIFLNQPYQIIKNGEAGVLEIRVFLVAAMSCSFWVWYGAAVSDPIVMYSAMAYTVLATLTVILILLYPKKKEQTAVP